MTPRNRSLEGKNRKLGCGWVGGSKVTLKNQTSSIYVPQLWPVGHLALLILFFSFWKTRCRYNFKKKNFFGNHRKKVS